MDEAREVLQSQIDASYITEAQVEQILSTGGRTAEALQFLQYSRQWDEALDIGGGGYSSLAGGKLPDISVTQNIQGTPSQTGQAPHS